MLQFYVVYSLFHFVFYIKFSTSQEIQSQGTEKICAAPGYVRHVLSLTNIQVQLYRGSAATAVTLLQACCSAVLPCCCLTACCILAQLAAFTSCHPAPCPVDVPELLHPSRRCPAVSRHTTRIPPLSGSAPCHRLARSRTSRSSVPLVSCFCVRSCCQGGRAGLSVGETGLRCGLGAGPAVAGPEKHQHNSSTGASAGIGGCSELPQHTPAAEKERAAPDYFRFGRYAGGAFLFSRDIACHFGRGI